MTGRYVGIDVGGTSIKAVLADASGHVLSEDSIATHSHQGPPMVMSRMIDMVRHLMQRDGEDQLLGVGVGVPGLVDVATGVTKFLPNMVDQWRDVPVAKTLSDSLGCPVRLLNDCRMATLGEWKQGHGGNRTGLTMAFFSLGTGVGGGLVIDGRLRLGPLGATGELGHQTILPNGPRCGCGNRGCLETLVSGPAIAAQGLRLMRSGLAPRLTELTGGQDANIDSRSMAEAADDDPMVAEVIDQAARYLGIAVANIITCLHPALVVIGGGVSLMGDRLLDPVREVVAERVHMFPPDDVEIKTTKLGDRAGIVGAVLLAQSSSIA